MTTNATEKALRVDVRHRERYQCETGVSPAYYAVVVTWKSGSKQCVAYHHDQGAAETLRDEWAEYLEQEAR